MEARRLHIAPQPSQRAGPRIGAAADQLGGVLDGSDASVGRNLLDRYRGRQRKRRGSTMLGWR
jgi:hypothetical protein